MQPRPDGSPGPPAPPERDETAVTFVPSTTVVDGLDKAMCPSATATATGALRHRRLPAFVEPGGAIDVEARRRGQTVYCPDLRVPLHPPVLSEGAASLLPGQVRPAFVWDLRLDADGEETSAEVYRALVRSVERFDYAGVQELVDSGTTDERWVLLREIGERRIRQERLRGGASLPMPRGGHLGDTALTLRCARPALRGLEHQPPCSWHARPTLLHAGRSCGHADATTTRRAFPSPAQGLGAHWPAEKGTAIPAKLTATTPGTCVSSMSRHPPGGLHAFRR